MIELSRVIDLAVSPEAAWRALWNVRALAACLPGCDDVVELEPKRRYRATVRDRVGPFKVTLALDVAIGAIDEGRHLAVTASGRDTMLGSPVRMQLDVSLEPAGAGARLALTGKGEVGGKLAALGQAVTQRKTRDTLERFATNLQNLLGGARDAAAV